MAGFEVLVTGDKTLEYEQNMKDGTIAVVSLSAPHWRLIKDHVGRIAIAVEVAFPDLSRASIAASSLDPNRPAGSNNWNARLHHATL